MTAHSPQSSTRSSAPSSPRSSLRLAHYSPHHSPYPPHLPALRPHSPTSMPHMPPTLLPSPTLAPKISPPPIPFPYATTTRSTFPLSPPFVHTSSPSPTTPWLQATLVEIEPLTWFDEHTTGLVYLLTFADTWLPVTRVKSQKRHIPTPPASSNHFLSLLVHGRLLLGTTSDRYRPLAISTRS